MTRQPLKTTAKRIAGHGYIRYHTYYLFTKSNTPGTHQTRRACQDSRVIMVSHYCAESQLTDYPCRLPAEANEQGVEWE